MKDERLANALDVLGLCIERLSETLETPPEDQRDLAGIIKHFELAFEQSYKCILELLIETGGEDTRRSVKSAFRRAFEFGWIADEGVFSAMIHDRNATSHTYDSEFAAGMVERISSKYLPRFRELAEVLSRESDQLDSAG